VTLLLLRAGRLAVDIDPEAGGSLARFAVGRVDILRAGHGVQGGCYPLVPYSNRIANGRFIFQGQEIFVPANWKGMRHPMHGDGWSHAWSVVRGDQQRAEIVYQHEDRRSWPFRYRARQTFYLDEHELVAQIAIENLETHAVPAGLGFHPFFMRDPDSELYFYARDVWLANAEVLPTRSIDVPEAWDFEQGRRPDDVALDNCFAGWNGRATIRWPSRDLRLAIGASSLFRHLVVYTPPGRPFFCVEPVSHANGAIGQTHLGARASLNGVVSFKVFQT
jgi:aldose 1-epimerase